MAELDKEKCKDCIHGDGNGSCITKEEQNYYCFMRNEGIAAGAFECNYNERFEDYRDD